jgi:hypothetical protein
MDAVYRMGMSPSASLPAVRPVTGRFLAHNHLTATRRAFLLHDVGVGKVQVTKLTVKQLAMLGRVSIPLIVAARRIAVEQPHLRSACETGLTPLLKAVPRPSRPERMAAKFIKMTAEEQQLFVRMVGADRMLSVAVEAA